MTGTTARRKVMLMDEQGNLTDYVAEAPQPSIAPRPATQRVIMTRPTGTPSSPPEPSAPPERWQPERPLPSHVEAMDEGPFDNPTVVTRSIDGLRIPIASLRVVDREGMDEARAEAVRLLARMDPGLSVGRIPDWGELLSILATASLAQRHLFDMWYERMAYVQLGEQWYSTEECLLGVHRPLPRGLALRKCDSDGRLCWRGGGMLWTDGQLAQARKPVTWSSRLFRRLGWS